VKFGGRVDRCRCRCHRHRRRCCCWMAHGTTFSVLAGMMLSLLLLAAEAPPPPPPPPPPGTHGGSCCTYPECGYNNATVVCTDPHNQCCTIEGNWASPEGVCYDNRTEACSACPVANPNHPVSGICPATQPMCCTMYEATGCVGADQQCCHHEGEEDAWSCGADEICCGFPPEWNPQGVSANHSCCKNSTAAREVCAIDAQTGHGSCHPLGAPAKCGEACADSEDCAAGGSACGSCTPGPDGYSVCMARNVAAPSAPGEAAWTKISLSGDAGGTSALVIEATGTGSDSATTVVALDVRLEAQGCGDPEGWLVINQRTEGFDSSPCNWAEQDIKFENSSALMYTRRILLSNLQTTDPDHVAPLPSEDGDTCPAIAVLPYRSRTAGGLAGSRSSSCFVMVSYKRVDSAATNNTLLIDSSATALTTEAALKEGALLLFNFTSQALNDWEEDGSGKERLAGVSGIATPFSVAISGVTAAAAASGGRLRNTANASPCSIMTVGLDYSTSIYGKVGTITLAGDGTPTSINPGSADAVWAIYVVSGSCQISVAAQPILPQVVVETAAPFDIQLNTRTPVGLGSTVVVAHPLPLEPPPADGTVHCFVFTATGGGAYLQMNIGSSWDYPLTPHGSGFYNNISTVTVSLDPDLNYTSSGGTVYGFVRVDMYGQSPEPDPKHPEWDDFKSVKGSLAWAVDARCERQPGSQIQGAQYSTLTWQRVAMMSMGEEPAVRNARAVGE
jgi:hypothetical protein